MLLLLPLCNGSHTGTCDAEVAWFNIPGAFLKSAALLIPHLCPSSSRNGHNHSKSVGKFHVWWGKAWERLPTSFSRRLASYSQTASITPSHQAAPEEGTRCGDHGATIILVVPTRIGLSPKHSRGHAPSRSLQSGSAGWQSTEDIENLS